MHRLPIFYLDDHQIEVCDNFKYLGSKVSKNCKCEDDVKHRVSVGWMKFQQNSGILCDKKFNNKLKGPLYTSAIRPALLYGSECWTTYEQFKSKLTATEMKMLRMMTGVTLKDKIKSNYIRGSLKVEEPIVKKLEQRQMTWYGHVMRRDNQHVVNKMINKQIPRHRRQGRPPNTWLRQMQDKQRKYGILDDEIQDRNRYRQKLRSHQANPTI